MDPVLSSNESQAALKPLETHIVPAIKFHHDYQTQQSPQLLKKQMLNGSPASVHHIITEICFHQIHL